MMSTLQVTKPWNYSNSGESEYIKNRRKRKRKRGQRRGTQGDNAELPQLERICVTRNVCSHLREKGPQEGTSCCLGYIKIAPLVQVIADLLNKVEQYSSKKASAAPKTNLKMAIVLLQINLYQIYSKFLLYIYIQELAQVTLALYIIPIAFQKHWYQVFFLFF